MAKGYRVAAFGGPEVMVWESLDLGELAPGAVRVRVGASGINFAETRMRAGDYSGQELPFVMGMEVAGTEESPQALGHPADLALGVNLKRERRLRHHASRRERGYVPGHRSPLAHQTRHRGEE